MSPSKVQVIIKGDTFPSPGDKQLSIIINGVPAMEVAMAPIQEDPEFTRFETGETCFVVFDPYCKSEKGPMKGLAVSPNSGKIFLADINTASKLQQWVRLNNYGNINGEGQGNFALVHVATGLALTRSRGELGGSYCHKVSLVRFKSICHYQDPSALWKAGRRANEDGFYRIHAATDGCYLDVDDTNNVVLRKDERSRLSLKFGGSSSGKIWKIMPLP